MDIMLQTIKDLFNSFNGKDYDEVSKLQQSGSDSLDHIVHGRKGVTNGNIRISILKNTV